MKKRNRDGSSDLRSDPEIEVMQMSAPVAAPKRGGADTAPERAVLGALLDAEPRRLTVTQLAGELAPECDRRSAQRYPSPR
jgi:hypothetical protein